MATRSCILSDMVSIRSEQEESAYLLASLAEQPVDVMGAGLMRVAELAAIIKRAFEDYLKSEVHCNSHLITR